MTDSTTEELFLQFERLIRDNSFHMGASAARPFRHFDLFASYLHYVARTDTHAGHAITAGVGWPFER